MPDQKQYLIQFLATIKGDKVVTSRLKQIERAEKDTGDTARRATALSSQFIKALKRVAIVVPVWFAFRRAMMAVFQTISQGVQYWIELESAIARAQAVTSGASMKMGNAMDILRAKAEDYARKHVGSAKEVVEAYYRMGTSGLAFRDAIMASIPATKLAKATYGDVATTAKTVSAIYRLMGDSIVGVTTKQEKMEKIADVLARTWTNHEIELNELSQAIANAGAQATSFGLTMTELIAVMAVTHDGLIKGGRAGRLFGRSLDELARKLPEVERILGRTFDPKQTLNWFRIFLELIGKFKEMGKTTPEIEKDLRSIFNIRSARQVRLLINQYDKLVSTLQDLEQNSKGTTDALLELRDATPEVQLENLRENINMLVRDFITGAMGTEDFVSALQELNENLESIGLNVTIAGAGIMAYLKNVRALWRMIIELGKPPKINIRSFLPGAYPIQQIANLAKGASDILKDLGTGKFGAVDIEKEMSEAGEKFMERRLKRLKKLKESRQEIREEIEKQIKTGVKINDDIIMRLKLADNLVQYQELELQGYDRIQTATQTLLNYIVAVVERLKAQNLEINQQELLLAIISKDWQKVLDLTQEHVITQEELVNLNKMVNNIQIERLKMVENMIQQLINHEVELMEIRGLSGSQLVMAKTAIEDAVLGRTDELREMERMLELEREVTKEKQAQRGLSSESVRLWKVAQQAGVDVATNIARLLRGQIDISDLTKREEDIFRKQFRTRWEQIQAQKFFFEKKPFFEPSGIEIPIRERLMPGEVRGAVRRIIKRTREFERKKELRVVKQFIEFKPTVPVDIKQHIKVNVDANNLANKVYNKVISELKKMTSPLKKAFDNAVESIK